ncbi:MAG: hypothetical protein JW910_11615 [Anaerolineae bacterium]|nr:hypothetical protein [Anaerolineae bacterium]
MLHTLTGTKGLAAGLIGALDVAVTLVTWPLLGGARNHAGATPDELSRPLPGDDLVPQPVLQYTRVFPLPAPPATIWPWLAQWGQGRGGLYSYDALENLVGCDIHSVDRILPEHQDLKPGDHLRFGPVEKNFPGQVVHAFEPGRYLLMTALDPQTRQPVMDVSWLLYLDAQPDGTTRLTSRSRNGAIHGGGEKLMWQFVAVLNFVMERKMMWTIRQHVTRVG